MNSKRPFFVKIMTTLNNNSDSECVNDDETKLSHNTASDKCSVVVFFNFLLVYNLYTNT